MVERKLHERVVAVKGGGEIASAVASRVYRANLTRLVLFEVAAPLAVRRRVSFCEAVVHGRQTVEGITAVRCASGDDVPAAWSAGHIAVVVDPHWKLLAELEPDTVVDAILAKRNLGTHTGEAALVIGLGPGFTAGDDVHVVVETNRGHNLGRIITTGQAEPNTGVPGAIGGQSAKRVLRAPCDGVFTSDGKIGDRVVAGDAVGHVDGRPVPAGVDGVVRGLIASGLTVTAGLKLGDVDPRGRVDYCDTISDKGRAIGGAVLEVICRRFNC